MRIACLVAALVFPMQSRQEPPSYAPAPSVNACVENERPKDGLAPAVCVIYLQPVLSPNAFPAGLALRAG